nr:hypothetical protein Iba_chr05cCG12700 [Ipomoea batatas]
MDVLLDDHVTCEVNVEETHEINQEGRMEVDESQLGTNFVDINIEAENEEYGVENFHAVEVEVEANLDTNIGVDEANQEDDFVSQEDVGAREVESDDDRDAYQSGNDESDTLGCHK